MRHDVEARDAVTSGDDRRLRDAERSENFPVALRALPAARRATLRRVYAVVRTIDDVGDEGDVPPAERLAALDELDDDLDAVFAGRRPRSPVVAALAPDTGLLSAEPFHDLVTANRRDQTTTRYATRDDLLDSCRLSAVPIGRLVLAAFAVDVPPAAVAESDRICTALQLLEHLQDVAEDRRRGRVYLPADARAAGGVAEEDLDARAASPALARLVRAETAAARALLVSGIPLVGRLRGAARLAVAGYAAGGLAAADALDRTGGDVLAHTARPRRRDVARHLARLAIRPPGGRPAP
ncbi:squalene synthase HpnC [Actinomycetospora cinnamomea]|uniref:Squalene synthase HpnC n=1 Tax=Actinomycetospora cinnamomea TaxID=663609 RepID=A0A2U1F8T8_9PSEU|nr:squalene synthase HpnC [Actinomycetospora cinnamomea]PVZ08584.1 squalene synthase HpnC [Actinomycetospora cinnamomea]